jgi:hypothetical protein
MNIDVIALIIQAVCGGAGGIATGKLVKGIDLGVIINAIAGIVGGGVGGQIINMLGYASMQGGTADPASIGINVASGAVGGGLLMTIVGFIKKLIVKK